MKYLNSLFIAAISLLLCCACHEQDETPETSDGPDYLVMFYGVGGGSLDLSITSNIFQALDAGGDDKVKMTFQYKASAAWQEQHPDLDGTRRFTSEENAHLKGQLKSYTDIYPRLEWDKCDKIFAELKSEKIGSAAFDMTSSESLADFIKWSKEKYPTVKHTILVLSGHGRGWTIEEDATVDTRAILKDDNTRTFMSMNTVVNGVKNAGNVDVIYADACLMGMYETLYGYADCAKYLLASKDPTSEQGGDYITFVNLLKEAGSTDEGMEEAMRKHCDHCVDDWWPKVNYSDIGFYNLTKINDTLTPVLKETVDMLVNKFVSNESVEPTKDGTLPLGDSFSKYISNAFLKCEIVDARITINLKLFSQELRDRMDKENVDKNDNQQLIDWLCAMYQGRDKEDKETRREIQMIVELYGGDGCEYSFSLTDLLRNLDNSLVEVGARNNPFGQLRKDLLSALKKMSYIKCITPQKHTGIDEEYELCSPGIMIVPFTSSLYESEINSRNSYAVFDPKDAMKIYQLTAFDRQIGWSRMLEKLDVIPSFLTNPTRGYVR